MGTTLKWLAGLGVVGIAAAGLSGCRAAYNVEVRNLADQPVTAKVRSGHFAGSELTLVEKYIGPGDHAALVVDRDANETISLAIDFAGNIGQPATLGLAKGKTTVAVRRTDQGSRGRIELVVQP